MNGARLTPSFERRLGVWRSGPHNELAGAGFGQPSAENPFVGEPTPPPLHPTYRYALGIERGVGALLSCLALS